MNIHRTRSGSGSVRSSRASHLRKDGERLPGGTRRLCISAFKSLLPRRESEINPIRCNETLTLADFHAQALHQKVTLEPPGSAGARRFQESNYVVDILSPYHNLISFCGGVGKRKLIAFLSAVRPFCDQFPHIGAFDHRAASRCITISQSRYDFIVGHPEITSSLEFRFFFLLPGISFSPGKSGVERRGTPDKQFCCTGAWPLRQFSMMWGCDRCRPSMLPPNKYS